MTAGGIAGCQGRRLNPMLRHCLILSLLVLPATAYADTPAPLPPAVRDMLAAAIASGNDTDIDTVARIAKQTNPDAAPEVDALVNGYREQKNKDNEEHIRHADAFDLWRSEEHTSELQSLMRISYAVFCLKKKTQNNIHTKHNTRKTLKR